MHRNGEQCGLDSFAAAFEALGTKGVLMNDDTRLRSAINLDELERQLREAAASRGAPQGPAAPVDDPLAELARLVGRAEMQVDERSSRSDRGFDEVPGSARPDEGFRDEFQAGAPDPAAQTGRIPPLEAPSSYAYPQERVRAMSPRGTAGGPEVQAGTDPFFEPERRGDPDFNDDFPEEPRRKSRGAGLFLFAAVSIVAAGGVGVLAWLKRDPVPVGSASAPLVKAETAPAKVPAPNPGGMEIPAQNTQIYNRSAPDDTKTARVVPSEEQPVDIAAAQRLAGNQASVQAGAPAAAMSGNRPGASLGMGEPKKVRSVTVRPDGTIVEEASRTVGQEAARVLPGNASGPTSSPPPRPQPVTGSSAPTPAGVPTAPPVQAPYPSSPVTAALPPPRPTQTPVVSEAPRTAPTAPASAPSVQSTASVPPSASAAASTGDTGTGDFAVQFGAPGSEAEARDTINRLQQRFGSVLGGYQLSARRAEVNNREIFRIRAGGLSREEANGLCERLKAAGGQCFVARN
jgi:hypothetical protein